MSFSITGRIKLIKDTEQIKDTFRKREFVLTDDSTNYPQHISFQLIQDNCDLLTGYEVGEQVTVLFNLKGREWTSPSGDIKYFNSLDAWKLERAGVAAAGTAPSSIPPLPQEEDDLPF